MCWWLAKTDAAAKSVSAVCVTTPTVPAMRSCVRSMHAQFDRACPVGNLVSRRRKWSLQCVSSTMVSTRMWIFRLADNHRDSDASILVFKSVAATVYAFSYSTRTPPTSGDDGVRQPSLQISLKRRGRKLLEQFLLVFRLFSRKNRLLQLLLKSDEVIFQLHGYIYRFRGHFSYASFFRSAIPGFRHLILSIMRLLLVHITGHFTASLTNNFWFSTYVITFFHH